MKTITLSKRIALALVALALACTGAASAGEQHRTVFVMAGDALFNIVQYVAEDAGFFRSEGVSPDIVNVAGGPRQVAAIMGGSADMAPMGFPLIVNATTQGGDMVAVATCYNMFSVALVLSNDAYARSGITEAMAIDEKVRRLRGLRLGITSPGSGTDSMARTLFAARGMNPDREITIQPLGAPENILAAFGRGVTDGFFYTSPMPETAVRRGLGRIVIEPLTGEVPELVDMPYVVLGTSRSNLKNQRPKVLAAVRAYTRAMQFVHAKPQEARQLVRARFPDVDDDVFNVAFDKYVAGVPRSPVIGPEQVAKTLDWLNLLQKTPLKAKYEDLVHPDIAREASRAILSQ